MADYTQFKLRGDTKSNWLNANPVLSNREIALETDTQRFKIGNGTSYYNKLPYGRNTGEYLNFYNVTALAPPTVGNYYTHETAILAVPSSERAKGTIVSYETASGVWYTERFIGSNVANWSVLSNWEKVPDASDIAQLRSDLNELNDKIEHVKDGGLEDGSIELPKLSPTLAAYIGSGGEVTNQADDDDLENTITNGVPVIREKTTKTYNPENYSGMGRVILRKNMVNGVNVLTQEMINQANTIYEIRYDFDLNGEEITIPEGCVLDFQGGSLSNGKILTNSEKHILILHSKTALFKNVVFGDNIYSNESVLFISSFINCKEPLKEAIKIAKPNATINIDTNVYHKDNTYIEITKSINIIGSNNSTIFIDNINNIQTGPFIYACGKDVKFTLQNIIIDGCRYGVDILASRDNYRFIETIDCDFVMAGCTLQNLHYAGSLGSGYHSNFMSIYKYKYCEISSCTLKKCYFDQEGIALEPVVRSGDENYTGNTNDHTNAKDFARIYNNRFLSNVKINTNNTAFEFEDPNEYVSTWFHLINGRCEFKNNYISGSNGSSVHLHVYDSVIDGNEFGNTVSEYGPSINFTEIGIDKFIPYNVKVTNNTIRNHHTGISISCGENIVIENNIQDKEESYPIINFKYDTGAFLSNPGVVGGYITERYLKNIYVKNNISKNSRSFISLYNDDNNYNFTIDNLVIEHNYIKLRSDSNLHPISLYNIPTFRNSYIIANEFDLGAYNYIYGSIYENKNILIDYYLAPNQTISNIIIDNNIIYSSIDLQYYTIFNQRFKDNVSIVTLKATELPKIENVVVKNNKFGKNDGILVHTIFNTLYCINTDKNKSNIYYDNNNNTTIEHIFNSVIELTLNNKVTINKYTGIVKGAIALIDSENIYFSEGYIDSVDSKLLVNGGRCTKGCFYYYNEYTYMALNNGECNPNELTLDENGYYNSGSAMFIKISHGNLNIPSDNLKKDIENFYKSGKIIERPNTYEIPFACVGHKYYDTELNRLLYVKEILYDNSIGYYPVWVEEDGEYPSIRRKGTSLQRPGTQMVNPIQYSEDTIYYTSGSKNNPKQLTWDSNNNRWDGSSPKSIFIYHHAYTNYVPLKWDGSYRFITLQPNNIGFQYFDTTLNKPIWWKGATWVDATGATV